MDEIAGIGHNSAARPADQTAALVEALTTKHATLLKKFADQEAGAGRVPKEITTEAEAGRATDFVGQCMALIDESKAAHKAEKAPWLAGCKVFDEFFLRRNERLVLAFSRVRAAVDAYRKSKPRENIGEPKKVTGAYGTVSSPKNVWTFDIEDPTAIPLGFLKPDEDAIQAFIDDLVSRGAVPAPNCIPGIKISMVETTKFRRAAKC